MTSTLMSILIVRLDGNKIVVINNSPPNKVLVIGAGIAGINTAAKLVETGTEVYLCERQPYIGGTLFHLDKWFPDNHCGMCQSLPVFGDTASFQHCLRQGLFHPGINILLNSNVMNVEGEADNFSVTINTRSSGIRNELCTGCGLCETVCPIVAGNGPSGVSPGRKAVRRSFPAGCATAYEIDKTICNKCGLCVTKCPAHAIDLAMKDDTTGIEVASIILASGFEEFDASAATAFGYGRYPNVITNLTLEQVLSSGATEDNVPKRKSDGKIPESIAFLQCIGSRTRDRDYCSVACCMYAVKEAVMLKQARPDIEATIFFMDRRDFGKSYYRYYQEASDKYGIKLKRCRVPVVNQDFRTKDLLITSTGDDNKISTDNFGMVVLSVGQNPSAEFTDLCHTLGITQNKWGFCNTGSFSPVETNRPGIYVCGSASGPKDITDAMVESMAAAGGITSPGLKGETTPVEVSGDEEIKTAVILCNCRGQLGEVLDFQEIVSFVKTLPGPVQAYEVSDLCHQESQHQAQNFVQESGANRLVIAGCSRLNFNQFWSIPAEVVNIRERLAWVHQNERIAAAAKTKALIKMAAAKVSRSETQEIMATPIASRALVIGGGLAGLTAALRIAEKGFPVELVEKSGDLGGNALKVFYSLRGEDIPAYVKQLISTVESNILITRHMQTELTAITGYAGNFKCILKGTDKGVSEIEAGAVIVAPGAGALRPDEYLYGRSPQVLTQQELEAGLFNGSIVPEKVSSVAMIQCVGSRSNERPYCSRICCKQALKNARLLKKSNPQMAVSIFYRDMMSYGLSEEYYSQAREAGILFFRYEPSAGPVITQYDGNIMLTATDLVLNESITLTPDLIVLSPAIVPCNVSLAKVLDVELDTDGFFKEAEPKFKTVDLSRDGIFVCGLAHSPRDIPETIAQAQAAAQRAVALLMKSELTSGHKIALVNERRCSGCEQCVSACPYHARVKERGSRVVSVISTLCRGCGTCVANCPNGASSLAEDKPQQTFSMLDAIA